MPDARQPNSWGEDPLLSLVADELRENLGPARGFVRLLLQGALGPLDEKQQQILTGAGKSLDRTLELRNELTELSTLEGRGKTLELTTVDLGSRRPIINAHAGLASCCSFPPPEP